MQIINDFHSARQWGETKVYGPCIRRTRIGFSVPPSKNVGTAAFLIPSFFFFFVISDQPEFNQIDQILLKQSHTAAVTFILEAVKQNADQSTIRYETAHRAFTVHPVCRWWL